MELRRRTRFISADVRQWDFSMLALACAFLAWVFARHTMMASRMIDGTRYFFLDDDMMISMRYGRNLVEGHGLVWNVGERVEGYTNFLWTIVMAGVHLLPIRDAHTAVAMKTIGFVLIASSLYLSVRLLRLFVPRSLVASLLLLVCIITCVDVVHWAAWGFETSLLTFLELAFLVCVFEERFTFFGYLALAMIPLTRGDALHLFAANAALAFVLAASRKKTALFLFAAFAPFVVHLLFRHAYYGEWLPNTYYLKVDQLDDKYWRGFLYVRGFVLRYAVLLTLAGGCALAIARTDRRGLALFIIVIPSLAYTVTTGGDMFGNFRFLAQVMPIIFIFAAAGVAKVVQNKVGALVWGIVLFVVSFPLLNTRSVLLVMDTNGDPYEQIEVAMLMKKNAHPESSVAVITAGILPYFTRMPAIDILGKGDKHIARLKPFPQSMVGHGKLDPTYTLSKKPDLVVSCRSFATAMSLKTDERTTDVVLSFLSAGAFQRDYRPNPIDEEFLMGRTAVYTNPSSSEYGSRKWKKVDVLP